VSGFASQGVGVSLRATRWPPCECGVAYGLHRGGESCQGYRPTAPVEDLGVRGYAPRPTMPLPRKALCLLLWAVERRTQGWRERLDRL
jgi:hypothetical protein